MSFLPRFRICLHPSSDGTGGGGDGLMENGGKLRCSSASFSPKSTETDLLQIPDPERVESIFGELVKDETTGRMISEERFLWGVYSSNDLGPHSGFIVDALYSVKERSLSLLAQAIENGEPAGYSWEFVFDTAGNLQTIDKTIDTQNLTGDSEEFEMSGADYYPGGNDRQKKEGLQTLQALLTNLETNKQRISKRDHEASLFR